MRAVGGSDLSVYENLLNPFVLEHGHGPTRPQGARRP